MRELEDRLIAAGRRLRWRFRLRGYTWGFGSLLVLVGIVGIVRLLASIDGPAGGWHSGDGLMPLLASASIATCVVLVEIVLRGCRPSLVDVSRLVDKQYGLKDRTTAAMDVWRRGATTRVERALLAQVAREANAIRPVELVPLRSAGRASAAMAGVLVIAVTGFIAVDAPGPPPSEAARNGLASPGGAFGNRGVEGLQRAAELVSRDARRRDDATLTALAQGLEELAEGVVAGEVTSSEAQVQLEALLERLAEYYGLDQQLAREEPGGLGNPEEGQMVSPGGRPASERAAEAGSPSTPSEPGDRVRQEVAGADEEQDGSALSLDALLDFLEGDRQRAEGGDRDAGASTPRYREAGPDAELQDDALANPQFEPTEAIKEAARRLLARDAPPDADLFAGPAEQEGPAGAGTAPLFEGEADDQLELAAAERDPIELAWDQEVTGRRIRFRAVPAVREPAVAAGLPLLLNWERAAEAPRSGSSMRLLDRDLAGHFFLPTSQRDNEEQRQDGR